MGNIRFGVPRELVLWLAKNFGINTFVETGTNRAETAAWAADHFERVLTVEGYEPLYLKAVENFGHKKNIQFLKGDSRDHIKSIVASLTQPAIFWLDAHWCGEFTFGNADQCPLTAELEELNKTSIEHIVLIDDARLFLTTPPPPNEANHWPDIGEVCRLLTSHTSKRCVVVQDDVIIGVPGAGRLKFRDYLRSEMIRDKVESQKMTPKNIAKKIVRAPLHALGVDLVRAK